MNSRLINHIVESLLRLKHKNGSYQDSNLVDIRPTAEIARGLLLINKPEETTDSLRWLLNQQHQNGSWGEVMSHATIAENTLATAIIAESLAIAYQTLKKQDYLEAAKKSFHYILSKETAPGSFAKTTSQKEDILNVDASCALFFHTLWSITKKKQILAAKQRAIHHIINSQQPNGAFPYTASPEPSQTFRPLTDPYYHSLTQHYLHQTQPNTELHKKLAKGSQWLSQQFNTYRITWSSADIPFSTGLIATYGYSASCFHSTNNFRAKRIALQRLFTLQQPNGLFPIFERIPLAKTLTIILNEFCRTLNVKRAAARAKKLIHPSSAHPPIFYHAQIFNTLTTLPLEDGS